MQKSVNSSVSCNVFYCFVFEYFIFCLKIFVFLGMVCHFLPRFSFVCMCGR